MGRYKPGVEPKPGLLVTVYRKGFKIGICLLLALLFFRYLDQRLHLNIGIGISRAIAEYRFDSLRQNILDANGMEPSDPDAGKISIRYARGVKRVRILPIPDAPHIVHAANLGEKFYTIAPLKGYSLLEVVVPGNDISDLSPLKGMPLQIVDVSNNPKVSDISALTNLYKFSSVDLSYTSVRDLSPLSGQRIQSLDITGTPAAELPVPEGVKPFCLSGHFTSKEKNK